MIPKKILNYLEKSKTKYEVVEHKTVYTAYDIAATLKMKLDDVVKTLMVKGDKQIYLLVLSGARKVNFDKVKKIVSAKKVEIVKEALMKKVLKLKPGSTPPFGGLFKLPVLFDAGLKNKKSLLVRAGSYEDSVKIRTSAFVKLEKPRIVSFSEKPR
jgi:Ala-tRNA(Pro) deacylase